MNEYEVLLEIFRNRGWLSARLISALLERSDADVGSYLAPLRSAGIVVQRSVRGGLVLYRLRRKCLDFTTAWEKGASRTRPSGQKGGLCGAG